MILNYVQLLNDFVKNNPDNVMFEYLNQEFIVKKITYRSFYKMVKTVIAFIKEKKLVGEKIGICMNNTYQWYVYFYAIVASGNTAVLIPIEASMDAQSRMIQKTETKYLFSSSLEHEKECTIIEPMNDIVESEGEIQEIDVDPDSTATIIFTSGTSGDEKAVCLSMKNCLFSANTSMTSQLKAAKKERQLLVLPFAHVNAIAMGSFYRYGNTICIVEEPKYFLKCLKIFKPDTISAVPMYIKLLIKNIVKKGKKEIADDNLNRVICAAAILSDEDARVLNANGIYIIDTYGMSETSGLGAFKCYSQGKETCFGAVYEGVNIEIIDQEIVISGDCIMQGYYGEPVATESVLKDGKLYTGDLGYFDSNGVLWVSGRKKNLIILSNGENISPESIEAILVKCEAIEECLVYGDDNKICVKIVKSINASEKEVEGAISRYNAQNNFNKRIRSYILVDSLERTKTGKLKR